jgi:hypothetical protein
MRKWFRTRALFVSEADNKLSEIIGTQTTDQEEDFCFDMNEVVAYNRSEDGLKTCIRLSNGFDITIIDHFDVFESIIRPKDFYKPIR